MDPHQEIPDSVEQAVCRLRTEKEERSVQTCIVLRAMVDSGAREIRLGPSHKSFDLD